MTSNQDKTAIIVAGPTAVGKTALAIRIAAHFGTSIISADSRQCYKELDIGVARPSVAELEMIKHYFVASHSIHEDVNASVFEQYALTVAKELFERNDRVVLTGGTGLYLKAFCEGLDEIPPVDTNIRTNIVEAYEQQGLQWLQGQIKNKDPEFYTEGEIQNPQRLMRALEVVESTGKSILAYRKGGKAKRDFNIIKIGLELPKEQLQHNIKVRTESMMEKGLLAEVEGLRQFQDLNALQTVGYSEMFQYVNGVLGIDEALHQIIVATRQYAKRQMTWFRRDRDISWFGPAEEKRILDYIDAKQGEQ